MYYKMEMKMTALLKIHALKPKQLHWINEKQYLVIFLTIYTEQGEW